MDGEGNLTVFNRRRKSTDEQTGQAAQVSKVDLA
jgi:hypothetical protein